MKFTPKSLAVAIAMISQSSWAADTYLRVFYDSQPVVGVEVSLDGQRLGATDNAGGIAGEITAGAHTLELTRGGELLTSVTYRTAGNEDAEIRVSFSSAEEKPEVEVNKYAAGDTSVNGVISGMVTDAAGNELSDASISVEDSDATATSGANGAFRLELPRGEYRLTISHPGYQSQELNNVRVIGNTGIATSVTLQPLASENTADGGVEPPATLEEMVVLGTFNPMDSSAGIERFSTTVTDALDIGQLERFGDSTAAAALTRIVGVSIAEGKYANVRGLDGRYISSSLNGLVMPSTDPMRRDVQLDLFPSNILEGVEIQKSYSPELLGTTTGGSVKMQTRGLPDEKVNSLSLSTGYTTDVTGEDIITYEESSGQWYGYDAGLRDLPKGVVSATDGGRSLTICDPAVDPDRCTSPLTAASYGVQFQDDYNLDDKTALPDFSGSYSYGDRVELDGGDIGYYGALSFKSETEDRIDATLNDPQDTVGEYARSKEEVNLSGYFVTGYQFRDADEILSKTIFLRSSDNTTRWEYGTDNEGSQVEEVILQWVERQFISQQFSGTHLLPFFGGDHQIDWRAGYSETERTEPDRRTYTYLNGNLSTSALERRWSDLNEDSIDIGVDYTMPLEISDNLFMETKFGLLYSDKSREVDLYRFSIQPGDNSDEISFSDSENLEDILSYQNFALDRVRLRATTTDTDSYEADEEITAAYFSSTLDVGEDWTVMLGARQEKFEQSLSYPNEGGSSNDLDSDELLPALAVTWRFNEEIQFRGGFSQTVSYPGIIERSESLSYDPETDDPIFGNPDLQVSTIDNFDLRAEYYFSDTESVSIAYFIKDIDSPIERAVPDGSGSAADGITFRNAESADISGIEIDVNKNVLDTDNFLGFIGGNVSFIESEVDLDADSIRLEGEDDIGRDLQGQSPKLANLQFGLDHYPTGQKFTLLMNYYDDRIYRVTRGANNGPEYEKGRIVVDFNYEITPFEDLTIKAQIQNLFDEPVEWEQNGRIIESYDEGISFSIGASYDF